VRRLLRPIGILLTLVLLQLVLVESGYACHSAPGRDENATAMANMSMPASADHAAASPSQHNDQQSPCRFPWAPNGCQTMAPCSPAALSVARTPTLALASTFAVLPPFAPLAPHSLSRAPELPPPRA
jgi:hypothetical protein